ncbi:phosphate uptake regulator [Pseudonocardia eucalypti]|nr:phosphate uptake regulator [Pseudonocardia eucalypti]
MFAACAQAPLAAALDATVVGRRYERFAQHAVSVADQATALARNHQRR